VITSIAARRVLDEHLARMQWIGVLLGFLGVMAVVADRLLAHASGVTGPALFAAAMGVLGISGGTLVQRKKCSAAPLVWSTTLQFAAGAVLLLAGAAVFERFDVEPTAATVWALVWAVLVLSIGAVMLMLWLLKHHAAANVSSLFFLTPALSTIEGAILFDERLGALAIVGLVVSLVGVALVTAR
jgi:drug/metabolite transporter (DMT)-like permease